MANNKNLYILAAAFCAFGVVMAVLRQEGKISFKIPTISEVLYIVAAAITFYTSYELYQGRNPYL